MYTYIFDIRLGSEYAQAVGNINVKANSFEDAEQIALDVIGQKLYNAFPEWDIPYCVELKESNDPDEN